MAPRRVVADSDDDDEEDDIFSPVKLPPPTERPEPEPLSPLRQPSSPGSVDELAIEPASGGRSGSSYRRSDKTDTSFFASVYDEQQKGVLQQSHLIENIVRQSQKASTGRGKSKSKAQQNLSSGTDFTSPIVLDRPVNHQSMFSDDETQLTTPRKSARGDVWDVPSSVESSRGKTKALTTYGKRKRGGSVLTTGPTGAALFGSDDAGAQEQTEQAVTDNVAADDGVHGHDEFVKPSPMPASKKPKVSLYDATAAQNSTTFYIAQSNLTTMQKLEYQKVSVPANPYNRTPGSTANQNSTCASTIPYSTPSLYASSGPPLPWERTAAEPEAEPEVEAEQPENSQHVIDITSSPDVMVSGHDRPRTKKTKSTPVAAAEPDAIGDPLPGLNEIPTSRTRHNSEHIEEVDELGQDEAWDSDTIDYHHETYRPRPSRRRSKATSIHEGEAVHEEVEEPVNVVDMGVEEEEPTRAAEPVVDLVEQNAASDATYTTPKILEMAQQDHAPTNQPKKRGRKKKQPVVEETIEDERPMEEPPARAEPNPPVQATEVEEVAEKPKGKRGRPRKSDHPKATEIAAPSGPVDPPEEPAEKAVDNDHNEVSPDKVSRECKPKKTTKKPREKDNVGSDTPTEDESPILTEKDANSRVPSRSVSSEPAGKKPKEVPATTATENKEAKSQAKETSKPVASQSKGLYRVGLSKKTRIAPLLKIIKK